ncbi:MAG: cofactor-independent phosphoglycerate mutase [Deltaproteobacteria bacterium]|nr:cofactor-independent phosphoglycerate mutase [Deltaproteobacteria bacterium]
MARKYLILIGDGMSDWPIASLGNRTPLEAAEKPNMDYMASHGALGMVQVVPKEMYPGSDVSNLSIVGYDPREVYTGRSPLEAASMGIALDREDVAVRCNVVALKNNGADSEMEDFSAGHISSAESAELLKDLQAKVEERGVRFYPGVSYRNLMVWPNGNDAVETTPPHDIHGKKITEYLPKGEGSDLLLDLMAASRELFEDHPVNRKRRAEGKAAGNSIWLWGQGKAPRIEPFGEKYGLSVSVVAAVDLIMEIGIYCGLEVVQVPGATGYVDTNYRGKAEHALRELEKKDFVLIHVEAPDEAGHNGSAPDKVRAIERIDKEMLSLLLSRAREGGDLSVMLLPDHPTPVAIRTHAQEPVPFVIYPAPEGLQSHPGKRYTEADARSTGQFVEIGTRLMGYLIGKRDGA